ncbi:MAG: presqualene diphosphate synthase HpnD [Verrucomicrobia bacterium]|jgi:phytoene synthase|nr:presqualene diphosphate synthase HpnD [Verrucomicrobiota bacterium]
MQTSRRITRKSASNLALAFALLPPEKRNAMSALYAFCREVDDVADEEAVPVEQRREQLRAWREDIRRACDGAPPRFPVNRELQPVIQRYRLSGELFEELIQGCEMDLDTFRYPTFDALEQYCHRVASVVGLLSIEIFGYRNPACRAYAIELGRALQLTNILRDVNNDAQRGRIYLPQSELARCGVPESEILRGAYSDRFVEVARSVARRARAHYGHAARQLPDEDRRAMVAAELMGSVYWNLLRKLEASAFQVFQPRLIRLGKPRKLWLIVQAGWRHAARTTRPAYGTA